MKSCLYRGWVRHRRHEPFAHALRYRLFLCYLDLDELPRVFDDRWLWSIERPNVASFRRSDYLGDPSVPLAQAVRDRVEDRTGRRPEGPIRLLTHLRFWGACFNPVSFYYCFDRDDRDVECIVAEITNTPWNERHAYVLPCDASSRDGRLLRHRFPKSFHVSPFIGMDVECDWRFSRPGEGLTVQMDNLEEGQRAFDATLVLERREMTTRQLATCLTAHPFMTAEVVGGIYWQALKLKLKGAPFFPHPERHPAPPVRRAS
ncbi:MAG: DUF1365 domain-containing protein [Acidobacteriota bacterium]